MFWNQRKASQTSRGSRSSHSSRGSHASGYSVRGSQPRELEFQFFIRQTETLYPPWWTRESMIAWFRDLPDDTLWNCYICSFVLMGVIYTVSNIQSNIYLSIVDVVYNISYAVHVFAVGYKLVTELEGNDIKFWTVISFLVDIGSFAHYVQGHNPDFKLGAYYARLHRPYKYLASLNDYNLKGSILGTTLKYCYIFMVLRITWAYVWLYVYVADKPYFNTSNYTFRTNVPVKLSTSEGEANKFLSAVCVINKMFIPIGPPVFPGNDLERICCVLVMMTGCLACTGAAVASLSLIISLYMRPEETFRARYRLIMKEMKETRVPPALRQKVETFYKMYWHKQRAVSQTQLLPIFPPTLPATINIDIYFEATQKARILRELSYQILSELAKKMETVHYIPGDAIIKRGSKKCKIIYITYGDVEMLTAEDDITAILRMTRGTVLTPCGGSVAEALNFSHLAVRAATFCTAHVLHAAEMWKIVNKHSVTQDHAGPILAAFTDHIERVKRHYMMKIPDDAFHKSSIMQFNRNLMALKQMKDSNGVRVLASSDVFLEIAGCYIMRNRLDATLTDQSDDICLRPTFPYILQPNSSLMIAWDSFVAVIITITCFVHPYNIVFCRVKSMEFNFFNYFASGVFVLDLFMYLSTGVNVEEGVPMTFTQTSSQQMRSHWFVLDVLGTLPIFQFIGDGRFVGINKLLRIPKLFRVLKSMEERCVYHSNVLRFLTYSLLLLIACYLIASVQQGFMCFQSGYCLVTNFTHRPYWEKKPLDEETVSNRLAFALYWAISMINFTFHRDAFGQDNWEHMLNTLVILEICIVLRTFMEAVYSATIMVTTAPREDYGSRIGMVTNFLIRNEVDPILRKRFIDYLQLCWHTDKAYKITHKKQSIFFDLPPHVSQDIVGRNRMKYLMLIPFMRHIKKEDLKTVSSSAKLFYTSPNEILLNTGELTNEIYIIKQGICEILDPKTKNPIGTLSAKNHFGALLCLLRLPAYYTIRAVTHVQVFSVPRMALMSAVESSQIKPVITYIKTLPEYHRLQTRLPSFVKYEPLPPTRNVMHFRLPRKYEPDTEFLAPFDRLGFLSILRYVFPRYTIRPDGKYLVRYEWFRVFCALCSAQLHPHYTYLVLQWPWLYYVAVFLDLSAWFDIIQRMLIGYFNEDGILVYHPSSTSAYYIKGAFIADFFGCLPLENLEAPRMGGLDNKIRVTPTKQFLMLNRLIQLYRLPSAMMVLKDYISRRDVLMVFQAIPLFMAMLNILTCFMIFYSVDIYYSVDKQGRYIDWFIEPFADPGGSWLHLFSNTFRFNMTETPWNLHLATYFWVVYECSTTGYGVFNPSNQDLMTVLFIGMASSTMIITYYSVRIISIRANVNNSLAGFQQHMKDINVYMAREKLNEELKKEIRRYYEYNWEKMGGIDYRGVLKLCDQITLRTDAILHIYGPTFEKCPLLEKADVSLIRIMGRNVRGVHFLRDMKIIDYHDMVTDMYFVNYGGVEIRVVKGEMVSIVRLPRGSVFGNIEGTATHRSPYAVVATGRLHVLMVKAKDFAQVMKDFPEMKDRLAKFKSDKMYILGGEAQVKQKRNVPTGPPPRSKKSLLKYIFFQEGLIQIYLLVVCMGCIYLDIYNAGFQDNSMWLIITLYALDFCFLLKILTQHCLPLLVTNKSMKTIMLPIRRLYFKQEFKYDLISILPIELFSFATSSVWYFFAVLRLNRTFRVSTVYKCLQRRNESITVNLTLTTVVAVSIWFTLFVHSTSCIWYSIAMMEDSFTPNSSWIHIGGTHCDSTYICSLYFVITTFTQNGVGDIMPKKGSEVVFVSFLQILATMVFMVYVGEFSSIIQYQSYRSFSFYSKYLELQEFLKNNRVSDNLVTIVNKYTLHLWRETRGLQVPKFLRHAPLSLRLRIMSAAYLHHMTRHHIFEECEPAFLRQLCGCLQIYTYNAGMYVVKESEITDSMYVIHNGKVRETCEEMDISARVYPAGSYFGIGLLRNTPYTHSYETMTKALVLTLNLNDWEYLLKHFPDSRKAIHKHMRQVGDKDMDQSNWPGGSPDAVVEVEPLAEIDHMPGELIDQYPSIPQYPTGGRHFGRVSEVEEAPGQGKRAFAWPTNSREADESGRKSVAEELERGESQGIIEDKPLKGFMAKFKHTAKKLMGKVDDTELLGVIEGKDELALEEDEMATENLLAQFEAAKKKAAKDMIKLKGRRKSVFHTLDQDTEKHLLTLDIEDDDKDDKTKATDDKQSETFMMRPLRIRDDEDETDKSSSTPEVLNLGRPKPTVSKEVSEVQVTIDMTGSDAAHDTTETATETKNIEPVEVQTTPEVPELSYTPPVKRPSVIEILRPFEPAYDNQVRRAPEESTDIQTTQSTNAQDDLGIKDEKPTEEVQQARSTQDNKVDELAQSPEHFKADLNTQMEPAAQDVPKPTRSKAVLHDTQDTLSTQDTDLQRPQATKETLTQESQPQDIAVTEPSRSTDRLTPKPKTADDIQAAKVTTTSQLDKDIQDTQPAQNIPITDDHLTPGPETADDIQATKDTTKSQLDKDIQDTEPGQNIPITEESLTPGPETADDIQAAKDTTKSQLDKDIQDIKLSQNIPITDDLLTPGPETADDIQATKDTMKSQLDKDIQDTKPGQNIPITEESLTPGPETADDIQAAKDTTKSQLDKDIQDIKPSQNIPITDDLLTPGPETADDIQAAKDTTKSQLDKDIQDIKPSQNIPITDDRLTPGPETADDIQATKNTTKSHLDKDIQDTEPVQSMPITETPKLPSVMSTTEDQADDQTGKIPKEILDRHKSFARKPIIFDPSQTDFIEDTPQSTSKVTSKKSDKKTKAEANSKEEGTSTSVSKLNRRFVQVRYDAKSEEDASLDEDQDDDDEDKRTKKKAKSKDKRHVTSDSDEPTDRSIGASDEGDDEATTTASTSASTSGSPASDKKEKSYRSDSY